LDPANPGRKVLGIDIDIRDHNRKAIVEHPMAGRIDMIQGSSIDEAIVRRVRNYAENYRRIMVLLDSNHTHDHVARELDAYAGLTSVGSYCIVYDTIIEDVPDEYSADRDWSRGDNPKTAVWSFLKSNPEFEIDTMMQNKLQITVAPDGFLKRIKQ
ncbi:MAG: CmcI family methyltransferase, partial [bacterium]